MINRVGQIHIHTVHIRYFWQGNHQICGNIRCIHTVLANSNDKASLWRCMNAEFELPQLGVRWCVSTQLVLTQLVVAFY